MADDQDERQPLLSESRLTTSISSQTTSPDVEEVEAQLNNKPHLVENTSSWKSELWLLLKYAMPLTGTYLLQYFYTIMTMFAAGHVGANALAAAAIGQTTVNITGMTLFEGMATALDTFCSQAYGSGNFKGVGLHMQRMICLMTATMIPVGALWICSPWWLPYVVKQQDLAAQAGAFLRISAIGMPGFAFFEAGKRFTQAQGNFTASLIVILTLAPVIVLLNWLFVFKLDWGLDGAALAQALTNDIRPFALLFYILVFEHSSLQCWGGLSSKAFESWGPMVRMSLPCAAVNLAEWGATEILTFSTSWISTNHLAAQNILLTMSITMWHIPFSVSVAISTRIGHLIGAGHLAVARRVTAFYAFVFAMIGLFNMAFLYLLRELLVRFFTEDKTVRLLASKAMAVVALFQVMDAIISFCNGTLRGLGRPSVGGWTAFFVNYFASVPFALWLELGSPKLELYGVWIGLAAGVLLQGTIETSIIRFMSWQKCIDEARSREVPD